MIEWFLSQELPFKGTCFMFFGLLIARIWVEIYDRKGIKKWEQTEVEKTCGKMS